MVEAGLIRLQIDFKMSDVDSRSDFLVIFDQNLPITVRFLSKNDDFWPKTTKIHLKWPSQVPWTNWLFSKQGKNFKFCVKISFFGPKILDFLTIWRTVWRSDNYIERVSTIQNKNPFLKIFRKLNFIEKNFEHFYWVKKVNIIFWKMTRHEISDHFL